MGILKYAFGAGYRRFYDNISGIAESEKKNRFLLLADAAFCTLRYGSGLTDYLNYEFWKRSAKERRQYVTIRTQDGFYKKVSPPEYKTTFTVKPNFLRIFRDYVKRGYVAPGFPDEGGDLTEFLRNNSVFMQKPVDGLGGHDVKKVSAADISSPEEYYAYLKENRLFVEQYITQHEKMASLCDKSVNTIRVMTSSVTGVPEIVCAVLRVGNGSCEIDNFHGGGMAAVVDVMTGTVSGSAVDKALNRFDRHPLSGIAFDGFEIPCWDDVRRIVCEAALVEPRIMMIGWDVAITPEGPVFVEGNRRPGFDVVQVAYGRGRMDIVKKALDGLKKRK